MNEIINDIWDEWINMETETEYMYECIWQNAFSAEPMPLRWIIYTAGIQFIEQG